VDKREGSNAGIDATSLFDFCAERRLRPLRHKVRKVLALRTLRALHCVSVGGRVTAFTTRVL